jgi:hypothetical protein
MQRYIKLYSVNARALSETPLLSAGQCLSSRRDRHTAEVNPWPTDMETGMATAYSTSDPVHIYAHHDVRSSTERSTF